MVSANWTLVTILLCLFQGNVNVTNTRKDNVFTSICHSVHRVGECLAKGCVCVANGGVYGEGGMHGEGGMCGEGEGVHGEGGMHFKRGMHGKEGGMHGEGACVAKGGMCGKGGHAWQRGALMAKGAFMAKRDMHGKWWGGGMHGRGHACQGGACLAGEMGTAVDSTHPTGMYSYFVFLWVVSEYVWAFPHLSSLCICKLH